MPELENDDLLTQFSNTAKPQLRVYEPAERVVVVGAGRAAALDVELAATAAAAVPVRRRRGGGGTVLLTPGQVVVALVTEVDHPFHNREYARTINDWMIESFRALGVTTVDHRGISDLGVGERKIVGTSIFRRRRILFYQASVLVENDIDEFERFLRMPGIVPDYRQGRSHLQFCTTLREAGYDGRAQDVVARLQREMGIRMGTLQ